MTMIDDRVLRSLRECTPGMSPIHEFHSNAAMFALDMEQFFYSEWLFIAHSAELPGPGSYLTLEIGEFPIVLTRAADGVIRAFINSCRDRGARVCPDAAGTAGSLVCPCHRWTYRLDGRLVGARGAGSAFSGSRVALTSVRCETVAGYIFVCLADEAPAFAPTRRQLTPYLLSHGLSEVRVAFQGTVIEECNWRLVHESTLEWHHCVRNHFQCSLPRNHSATEHVVSLRVLPVGPARTELTTKWLVHRDAVEGIDYDIAEMTEAWLAAHEHNRRAKRWNEIAMS